MTEPTGGREPLLGFTVAITAARRADEFAAMLRRRGAVVVSAPAIEMVPLADDAHLRVATDELLAEPPDMVIATTGIGFRGWIEAAEGWGLAPALLDVLGRARVISRGPKATGALRAAGLREEWSPASESSAEVLEHLGPDDLSGRRVAVQLHGATDRWDPTPGFLDGLAERGATVVPIPVYRWQTPPDPAPLDALIDDIALARVDAVAFTSAPAVASLLLRAEERRLGPGVRGAMSGPVTAFCVGPVTASPLDRIGVPTVTATRMRLGALARLIEEELPRRRPVLSVAGHSVGLRAAGAVVDGGYLELTPNSLLLLRMLAREPGAIVTRDEVLEILGGGDPHAVEAAVARLRGGLGAKELVATVVKRGYRLPVDEVASPS